MPGRAVKRMFRERLQREGRLEAFEKRLAELAAEYRQAGVEARQAMKNAWPQARDEFPPLDVMGIGDRGNLHGRNVLAEDPPDHSEPGDPGAALRELPDLEFREHVDLVGDIAWVWQYLDNPDEVQLADAPSRGARALARWAAQDKGTIKAFYDKAYAILASHGAADERRRYGDKAKPLHELLDSLKAATGTEA